MISLGRNITSFTAQRRLSESTSRLGETFQRLSSGLRINKASDDAAGLSVATTLRTQARVFGQGIRNVNDGISALNIAEGALSELRNITIRQMELAEQAANGSYSQQQRTSMNSEANALVDEFNRIVQSTSFNGVSLLQSSTTSLLIQGGYGLDGAVNCRVGSELARIVGTGAFQAPTTYAPDLVTGVVAVDVNRDGLLDIVESPNSGATAISVLLGNGDGSFRARMTFQTGAPFVGFYSSVSVDDLNGDGLADLVNADGADNGFSVMIGNGDGTFRARTSFTAGSANTARTLISDFNGDGRKDVIVGSTSDVSVFLGNGDGTFRARNSYASLGAYGLDVGDLNSDGIIDFTATDSLTTVAYLGNGNGSFRRGQAFSYLTTHYDTKLADFNNDNVLDLSMSDYSGAAGNTITVCIGNGDGTFRARTSYVTTTGPFVHTTGDINGDGNLDIATGSPVAAFGVLLGNGDGTFRSSITGLTGTGAYSIALGDFNRDGALDVVTPQSQASGGIGTRVSLAVTSTSTLQARMNLYTSTSARSELSNAQNTLSRVVSELGSIGASRSRLEIAARNLSTYQENSIGAESRIMDSDIALESAELARISMLRQAGAAVLSQANLQPQIVLQLLQD